MIRRKVSKASVSYRKGNAAKHCGNCAMYKANSCDLVEGKISPQYVCDRWVKK